MTRRARRTAFAAMPTGAASVCEISVVIPVFNNAHELAAQLPALRHWLDQNARQSEVVLVDDGSDPGSARQLEELTDRRRGERLIRHEKNLGQHMAIATGFSQASGAIVITSDADFVVPAAQFNRLLSAIGQGHDFVMGQRTQYARHNLLRTAGAHAVRWLVRLLYKINIDDFGCGTNALSRALVERFRNAEIPHDVMKLAVLALSQNPVAVDLSCGGYQQRQSSYSIVRLVALFVRIVTFRFRARAYF